MRYAALFAPESGLDSADLWLAGFFGDAGGVSNLTVELLRGSERWRGGCAAVTADEASGLAAAPDAPSGLTVAVRADAPDGPAAWWAATAAGLGLARPSKPPD